MLIKADKTAKHKIAKITIGIVPMVVLIGIVPMVVLIGIVPMVVL